MRLIKEFAVKGNVLDMAINFLILPSVIFFMAKAINQAREQFEGEKKAEPSEAPGADVVLLGEIRDLLKQQQT